MQGLGICYHRILVLTGTNFVWYVLGLCVLFGMHLVWLGPEYLTYRLVFTLFSTYFSRLRHNPVSSESPMHTSESSSWSIKLGGDSEEQSAELVESIVCVQPQIDFFFIEVVIVQLTELALHYTSQLDGSRLFDVTLYPPIKKYLVSITFGLSMSFVLFTHTRHRCRTFPASTQIGEMIVGSLSERSGVGTIRFC